MLLEEIDIFLERTGMSATAFSKAAMGDPNFVRDLRAGREPRARLVQRAREYMESHSMPSLAPETVGTADEVQS